MSKYVALTAVLSIAIVSLLGSACTYKLSQSRALPMPGNTGGHASGQTVGFLVVDSDTGRAAYDTMAQQVKTEGMSVSDVEYYPAGQQDFSSLIANFKNSGVDIIWVIGTATDKANIRNDLSKLGVNVTLGFTGIEATSQATPALAPALSPAPVPAPTPPPTTPSSSGGKIAFESYRDGTMEIYIMNADGSNQVRLTYNNLGNYNPSWSPDGTKIAFVSGYDTREIYKMNSDGSNPVRLTNDGNVALPAWSPDGQKIAFISGGNINVMNANGSNPIRLVKDGGAPAWSPDGKKIAFSSYRDGNFDVYVVNSDGTDMIRLTTALEYDQCPVWSPNGEKIAFVSGRSDGEIFTMNVDGSNQVPLTDINSNIFDLAWSPDGTRIAFTSDLNAYRDIYVINSDGSNLKRLTDNPKGNWHPSWSTSAAPASALNVP